jgi:hypothetical protein
VRKARFDERDRCAGIGIKLATASSLYIAVPHFMRSSGYLDSNGEACIVQTLCLHAGQTFGTINIRRPPKNAH